MVVFYHFCKREDMRPGGCSHHHIVACFHAPSSVVRVDTSATPRKTFSGKETCKRYDNCYVQTKMCDHCSKNPATHMHVVTHDDFSGHSTYICCECHQKSNNHNSECYDKTDVDCTCTPLLPHTCHTMDEICGNVLTHCITTHNTNDYGYYYNHRQMCCTHATQHIKKLRDTGVTYIVKSCTGGGDAKCECGMKEKHEERTWEEEMEQWDEEKITTHYRV